MTSADPDFGEGPVAKAAPRMAAVLAAPAGSNLSDLCSLADLDRATDFRHQDLRGWPFAHHDLRGFDLTGSDLRGTGVEKAVIDGTTVLGDAVLDAAARRRLFGAAPTTGRPKTQPCVYTRVHIPDLSDDELMERSFVIRDPLALDNVAQEPPPTDQLLSYEGRYDIGQKVRCAFGHPHQKGYVFRDEHGLRYLVGNSCGSKHLGMARWQEFAAKREDLEERASRLKSLRDLRDLFSRTRPALAAAALDPAVEVFDRTRDLLATRHPQLVKAVRQSAAFNGRIQLPVLERDFAAEERERERLAAMAPKAGAITPIPIPEKTRRVMKDVGALTGRVVFETRPASRTILTKALKAVDAFLASDVLTSRRGLQNVLTNARRLALDIVRAIDAPIDFATFFAPSNMTLLVRWANQNRFDDCDFSVRRGTLFVARADGSKTIIAPPPKFDVGEFDDLRRRAAP